LVLLVDQAKLALLADLLELALAQLVELEFD
jgi:hypothetical protein